MKIPSENAFTLIDSQTFNLSKDESCTESYVDQQEFQSFFYLSKDVQTTESLLLLINTSQAFFNFQLLICIFVLTSGGGGLVDWWWQLKKTAHIIIFWLDCSMAFGFSGGCALVFSHFSIKVH